MNKGLPHFRFLPRLHSMNHMKRIKLVLPLLTALAFLATGVRADAAKIKVLIIDGQNNHKWAETTPYLKAILVEAGVFTVDVSTTPPSKPIAPQLPKNATPQQKAAHAQALKASEGPDALWAKWRPRFSDYDVIVSNYNGEGWPEEVRAAFVAFVKNGGGFVSYHAADNAFADWADYNEMIALGGWGGRNEKSGPYLRLRKGMWTKAQEPWPLWWSWCAARVFDRDIRAGASNHEWAAL
jgi:hypothetical protein